MPETVGYFFMRAYFFSDRASVNVRRTVPHFSGVLFATYLISLFQSRVLGGGRTVIAIRRNKNNDRIACARPQKKPVKFVKRIILNVADAPRNVPLIL